jgi:triosephosphate isomerase
MKLVAGNWKMNGLRASEQVLGELLSGLASMKALPEILVCPPATLIVPFATRLAGTPVATGGQGCHPNPSGAHTGDISAEMLKDAGASYVIVGHSERRTDHGESNQQVAAQATAARRAGLKPIICIGESASQYDAGQTEAVLAVQIRESIPKQVPPEGLTIAYEPIWAIGTGKTPTTPEIVATHRFIRSCVAEHLGAVPGGVRILYGGSVKPSNASEILSSEGVDGALVGGASLKASDFLAIIAGCPAR